MVDRSHRPTTRAPVLVPVPGPDPTEVGGGGRIDPSTDDEPPSSSGPTEGPDRPVARCSLDCATMAVSRPPARPLRRPPPQPSAPLLLLLLPLLLLHVPVPALAAIAEHRITALPGFDGPLRSAQYSGYLNVDPASGRYLHYWLVLSERAPATDPLVLWLNGGPGCSSLDGYFYEQGPLHFRADDTATAAGVPRLRENPFRWNRIANMLFLEAPAGVGFSYADRRSDYATNDTQTALDNYAFLLRFFAAYPELAGNDFYISGESYAGIYVPTLVDTIRVNAEAGRNRIRLKGFLVGNGCTGRDTGICSSGLESERITMEFLHGHALFSNDLYEQIRRHCNFRNASATCRRLLGEMHDQVSSVNIYNIYGPCISGPAKLARRRIPRVGGPDGASRRCRLDTARHPTITGHRGRPPTDPADTPARAPGDDATQCRVHRWHPRLAVPERSGGAQCHPRQGRQRDWRMGHLHDRHQLHVNRRVAAATLPDPHVCRAIGARRRCGAAMRH